MSVIKYLRLPFQFDALKLQEEVERLNNANWLMHYQTRHYEGEWSAIPLRSTGGKADNVIIAPTNDTPYLDTVFLESSPYLKTVLQTFQCPCRPYVY
ncbi:MAG: hypothetical protein IPI66_01115 [Chitinophagaceae bacterium]|nr:hypothetical protein [Chitinophagaceae bacterium]